MANRLQQIKETFAEFEALKGLPALQHQYAGNWTTIRDLLEIIDEQIMDTAVEELTEPPAKRRPLPERRQGYCLKLEWRDRGLNNLPWNARPAGQSFFIHVNFYDEAKTEVGEVFADIGKVSSSIQQLVAAACIIISVAVQSGVTCEELLKSQPRYDPSPDFPEGEHFTILGIILQEIVDKSWEQDFNADNVTDEHRTGRTAAQDNLEGRPTRVGRLGRLEGVTPSGGASSPSKG